MTVVAIISILAAFAFPQFADYIENARYRETASNLTQTLKRARSEAITRNREVRAEMDIDGQRGQLIEGDRTSGSAWCGTNDELWTSADNGTTPECNRVPIYRLEIESNVVIGRGNDAGTIGDPTDDACNYGGLGRMVFTPKGTVDTSADFDFLCVTDTTGTIRYYLLLTSKASAQIQTGKPSSW